MNTSSVGIGVKSTVGVGVALTSLSYLLFTFHDAGIKMLVTNFSVWQILFFRSLTIVIGATLFGGKDIVHRTATSPIMKAMMIRSLFLLAAWMSYYTAARDLPLAELTTLYYAAPVVGTLLAAAILKEKVTPARWLAVFVGFTGVVIACNPAGMTLSLPVYLSLQAAFLWAFATVLLRKTALQEATAVQVLITNIFFLILTGAMTVFTWHTPTLSQLLLLVGIGVVAGIAQFANFEGIKSAPLSVVAPFEYTALIWAFLLGYAIWGDIPKHGIILGASLIFAAGFIIIFSERLGRRPRPQD